MRFPSLYSLGIILAASLNSVCRGDGFEVWRAAQFSFSELSNTAISGETADPDGDGIPNLIEYVQARAAKIADTQAASYIGLFNSKLTLSYRERNDLGGSSIWLQGSDDLIRWTTYNTRQEASRLVDTEYSTVTLLDYKESPYDTAKRFLRLRVDRTPAPLVAPNKVEVGFNSPTNIYVIWGDLNTAELGYKVTHYDDTYGYRVVSNSAPDVTKASGLVATAQTGFYFSVSTLGPNSSEIQSTWATPPDRDGDSIPDYLERQGQTIIAGTYNSNPDSWDTDGDGLSDTDEIIYYNTNPGLADTDMDGLPDGWEVNNGFNPNQIDDASADPDGDNLSNLRESQLGTNPFLADSDSDGLTDGQEADVYRTNPLAADTDDDHLNDGPEVLVYHTEPLIIDTDGDGLPDGWEVTYGLDPLSNNDAAMDTDADGLNNLEEYIYSTSPLKEDTDNDGLLDAEEVQLGTNAGFWDTDSDGISDLFEVDNGLLPSDPSDAYLDPDTDGLSNLKEYKLGTDPHLADTDGGGTSDAAESAAGGDPTDRSDDSLSPLPSQQVDFALQIQSTGKTLVGNCAVCHNLQAKVGSRLVNDGEVIKIWRDKVYEISLIDKITQWPNNGGEPPHDNSAKFTLWPIAQSGQTLSSSANGQQITVSKNGAAEYFIDNSSQLLAQDKAWNDNVLKKKALVGLADLDVLHPASGELEEEKEDYGLAGVVAIKRTASTPTTKLLIKKTPQTALANSKYRIKYNAAGRYIIYADAPRTQSVSSEITEFPANANTELYLEGTSKSASRSAERITLQIKVDNQWLDTDSVALTVVQAEFLVQIKAFIPYAWTEAEDSIMANLVMAGKVAKGDKRSFAKLYSDTVTNYSAAPFRLMQKVLLTPYPQLHQSADIATERDAQAALLSSHYIKATSIDPSEINLHYGSIDPVGTPYKSKEAKLQVQEYSNITRTPGKSSIEAEAQGEDGAMPWWTLGFAHNIDWKIKIGVSVLDPFNPVISASGKHDRYPSYEIIGLNSEGAYEFIHTHSPAVGDRPGPESLRSANAVQINETKAVK